MKLKAALSVMIGVGAGLGLMGLVHAELSNRQRQVWHETTAITHDLARSVSDLESLAYEWILRPTQRPVQQWEPLKKHIERNIEALAGLSTEMAGPSSLTVDLDRADRLFRNLVEDATAQMPVRRRVLIDQLLVHTRELSLQADLLLSASMDMQNRSTQRDLFVFYLGLGLTGLAAVIVAMILHRRILRPLASLERATRLFGQREATEPIPKYYDDELGLLIDSFNEMMARMRRLTRQMEEESVKRAEEDLLHNLAESQPQPVWTADDEGFIQWKNQAFKTTFGVGYIGSLWTDFVHPGDRQPLDKILAQAASGQRGSVIECRLATLQGWRWFVVRTAAVQTATTAQNPWICTAGDIHERRTMEERLRDARQRAETLNRISIEMTGELNPMLLARSIVTAACELLHGEFAVFHLLVPGRDGTLRPEMVFGPTEGEGVFEPLKSLPTGFWPAEPSLGCDIPELPWEQQQEMCRIKSMAVVPVSFGGSDRDGCLFVAHRSPDRFNEDDLRLLISLGNIASAAVENVRLHTVERAAIRLADSRSRQLERSNSDLQEFAYVASHDLQEPLRMITAYLDVLRAQIDDRIETNGMRYLERASDAATRMTRLVKDLLTYSRAGHDGDRAEEIDLTQLVRDLSEDLRVRLDECDGRIVAVNLPRIAGRHVLVRQVLMNLIQNGLKYRHGQRLPVITISATVTPTTVTVHVADNGLGIPEQYQERIFRLFQRLNRGPAEGSGIGLSICRKLVRSWGGDISVASDGENGSVFSFTVPAGQLNGATPSASFQALV